MTTEAEIALVIWVNDRPIKGGIICMSDIHSPRKELKDYCTGDKVMAVCRGFRGYHECIIAKIAEKSCKAELCKQLDGDSFIEILQSFNLYQASVSKGDTSIPKGQKQVPLDGKDERNNRQKKKQKTNDSQKGRPAKKAGNSETKLVNIANDLELSELKKYVNSTMTGSVDNDPNQSSVFAVNNGWTVDGPLENITDAHEVCVPGGSTSSVEKRNNRQTFGTVFSESLRVLQGSSNEDLLEERDCCPCKHKVTALETENKNLQTKYQSLEYEVRNIWSWIHHLNQRNVDQTNQPPSFASFLNESIQDTPDVLAERQTGCNSSNRIECPGLTKTYGGYTKSQLEAEIRGISDFSKAAKKIFRMLYSADEYMGKTLTGAKPNNKYTTRPPLEDQSRIKIIYEIIKEKYDVGEVMVRRKLRDLVKPSRVTITSADSSHGDNR